MTFNEDATLDGLPYKRPNNSRIFNIFRLIAIASSGVFIMFTFLLLFLSGFANVDGSAVERQVSSASIASTSSVPQYFQTTPEIYAGRSICRHLRNSLTIEKAQHPQVWLHSLLRRTLRLSHRRAIFPILHWRRKFQFKETRTMQTFTNCTAN